MGSLVCALASYLDARHQQGCWLIRIEDIDPPREQQGADQLILQCLSSHGLHWDQPPLYQSHRSTAYKAALAELANRGLSYPCNCNRSRLKTLGHLYDGHCLQHPPAPESPSAIRLNKARALEEITLPHNQLQRFDDCVLGEQTQPLEQMDDFVIHRKDGLYAYQLAVVVDDIFQRVSCVIRGADLLDTTVRQQLLFHTFGNTPPRYGHVPLVVDGEGRKLSKQNHAPAVDPQQPSANLAHACQLLGLADGSQRESLAELPVEAILQRAVAAWQPDRLPRSAVAAQA